MVHARGEDCLNLNIWRNPADKNEKKPILISPALTILQGSAEASRKLGQAVAEKLKAASMQELMAAPEAELKAACAAMGDLVCGPVPDGKLGLSVQ